MPLIHTWTIWITFPLIPIARNNRFHFLLGSQMRGDSDVDRFRLLSGNGGWWPANNSANAGHFSAAVVWFCVRSIMGSSLYWDNKLGSFRRSSICDSLCTIVCICVHKSNLKRFWWYIEHSFVVVLGRVTCRLCRFRAWKSKKWLKISTKNA